MPGRRHFSNSDTACRTLIRARSFMMKCTSMKPAGQQAQSGYFVHESASHKRMGKLPNERRQSSLCKLAEENAKSK